MSSAHSKNIAGLLLFGCIFLAGFIINGNLSLYFNISGLMIVSGGTIAASMLSFRISQLKIVAKVVLSSYFRPVKKESDIINILIDLSIKSRIDGVLSLQENEKETSILFLRRALGCLVDGYKAEQIRDILNTEMYFFKIQRIKSTGRIFP